jgi:hypothetical protein
MVIKKEKINLEMGFMFPNKITSCLLLQNLFLQEFSLLIMIIKHVINLNYQFRLWIFKRITNKINVNGSKLISYLISFKIKENIQTIYKTIERWKSFTIQKSYNIL